MEGYDFKPGWRRISTNSSWKGDGKVYLNLLGIPPKIGFEGRTRILERNNETSSAQMIMCVIMSFEASRWSPMVFDVFVCYLLCYSQTISHRTGIWTRKGEIIYQISRIGSPAIRFVTSPDCEQKQFDSPGLQKNRHSRRGSSPHKMQQNDWHTGRTKLFDINSA